MRSAWSLAASASSPACSTDRRPFAITLGPAIFGLVAFAFVYGSIVVPPDLERRLIGWADGHGRISRLIARLAAAPATVATGIREAQALLREREAGALAGFIWWGFDIATLWASFHAFGADRRRWP